VMCTQTLDAIEGSMEALQAQAGDLTVAAKDRMRLSGRERAMIA
jgi:hypothetical protein